MVFPVAELKFSRIQRTSQETSLLVRLYRVDDGGLDAKGQQQYLRTLKRERPLTLAPSITKVDILTAAQQKLSEWAIEEGFVLPVDRLLCTL